MIGRKFGYLVVVKKAAERSKSRGVIWECACECGTIVKATTGTLTIGDKKSCGCRTKEMQGSHGMYGTSTHNSWRSMRDRLKPHHKSYEYYEGIGIDPRWDESFSAFFEDMGERPEGMTLDRKDGSKGYWKWNCRWANLSTQQQNKRVSSLNCNGYPGIFFGNDRYVARIRHSGKRLYLGCYLTAEEAHAVYDAKGRELFGEEWKSYFDKGQRK